MNNEEIAIKLTEHDEKIKTANHRIDDLENIVGNIQDLTVQIRELTMQVKNMVDVQQVQGEEQKRQAEKIQEIEDKPDKEKARLVNNIVEKVILLLVVGMVSYLFFQATGISL